MKKILNLCFCAVLLTAFACSTTKTSKTKAVSYEGSYEVKIVGTPQGDMTATINIIKGEDGTFTGNMESMMGKIDLQDVVLEGANMTSKFSVQGMDMGLNGTFTETTFTGKIEGMGGGFPVTGTKITE